MHVPAILQERLSDALAGLTDSPQQYASMIRGTNDPAFGDYQVNCAMPLAEQIDGKNPREIAAEILADLKVDDLCDSSDVAGPGFINLTLADSFIAESLAKMIGDDRCLVAPVSEPKNIVVDFSSPNVAKPMHVGHIRSTVIGDSLARVLRFLGHNVTTDNHLGDWGTQFGIIIYGYKHFGDPEVVKKNPVPELAALYRQVNQLIEYRKAIASVAPAQQQIADFSAQVKQAESDLESVAKPDKNNARHWPR